MTINVRKSTSFVIFLLFTNVFGMQERKTVEEIQEHNKKTIETLLTQDRFTKQDGLSMIIGATNQNVLGPQGFYTDYSRFVGTFDVTVTDEARMVDFEKTDLLSLAIDFNDREEFKELMKPLKGKFKKIVFDLSVIKSAHNPTDLIIFLIDLLMPNGTLIFEMAGFGGWSKAVNVEFFHSEKVKVEKNPDVLYFASLAIPRYSFDVENPSEETIKRLQEINERNTELLEELYEIYAKNNIDLIKKTYKCSVSWFRNKPYPLIFLDEKASIPKEKNANYFVVTKGIAQDINQHNQNIIATLKSKNRLDLAMVIGAGNIGRDHYLFAKGYDVTITHESFRIDPTVPDLLSLLIDFDDKTAEKLSPLSDTKGLFKEIIFYCPITAISKSFWTLRSVVTVLAKLLAPGGKLIFIDPELRVGFNQKILVNILKNDCSVESIDEDYPISTVGIKKYFVITKLAKLEDKPTNLETKFTFLRNPMKSWGKTQRRLKKI